MNCRILSVLHMGLNPFRLRTWRRMTLWLQQMHLGIHQLPGHGIIEEKPNPCTASAVSFMSRALQARCSVDGSVIVLTVL